MRASPAATVRLLSVATGIAVANLYYAQPVAADMARSLEVSEAQIGFAMMLTQVGYALGMLVLVPLGDGRERRSLIVWTSAAAAVVLVLVATAQSFAVFAATSLALGFASSVPQMILPYAVGLVDEKERGKTIGAIMSGLLAGILLSRTASGAVASAIGWRLTLGGAAALMAVVALVLRVAVPEQRPKEPLAWLAIVRSLGRVVATQPLLRKHALVGALGMGTFSAFWSTLAFHLARQGHGSSVAGAFGVIGVVGVGVAPIVGRISGRIPAARINAVGLLTVAAAFVVFFLGGASLVAIGVGVVLLDAGAQASHLANQTVILGLAPEVRNRLNAVYMVTYFAGGSLGTLAATSAWARSGWAGVCAVGVVMALGGFAASFIAPRDPSRRAALPRP